MERIVFFDIDGTLMNEQKEVPESTREAIRTLQKNGTHVAIATGRAPFMFKALREQLNIHNYVSFNGQYVMFEGDVIFKQPVPRHMLEQLESDASERAHPMVFMDHEQMTVNQKDHPWVQESISGLKVALPEYVEQRDRDKEIYQALLFCEEQNEGSYVERYGKLKFIRWHRVSLDVLTAGGSKAQGISEMIKRLQIDMRHVYAFGDALNDLEMLQTVGTGVAMGNAAEIVKRSADLVTKTVEEDGIYYGLKQLSLI